MSTCNMCSSRNKKTIRAPDKDALKGYFRDNYSDFSIKTYVVGTR